MRRYLSGNENEELETGWNFETSALGDAGRVSGNTTRRGGTRTCAREWRRLMQSGRHHRKIPAEKTPMKSPRGGVSLLHDTPPLPPLLLICILLVLLVLVLLILFLVLLSHRERTLVPNQATAESPEPDWIGAACGDAVRRKKWIHKSKKIPKTKEPCR